MLLVVLWGQLLGQLVRAGDSAVGTEGSTLAVVVEGAERGILVVVVYGLGRRLGFHRSQPFLRAWCYVLCGRASRKLVLCVHWG